MLKNIFKKTKIREKIKILPKIIIDIHEKNSLVPSKLMGSQVETEFKALKIGDYQINNIVIERKTFSDFISSMISKRLIQQLNNLKQTKQPILIIEGAHKLPENSRINANSYKGFIISILTNYQIPIITTRDESDTSNYLVILAKQQLKPLQKVSLHSRIPRTKKEQKRYVLESFPNIGPKTSEKLIKKYKTIKNILNLPKEELEKELGKKAEGIINLRDY